MPSGSRKVGRAKEQGFIYVAVLAALLILALSTQVVMGNVSQAAQREREEELLSVGALYVQAIGRYYQATPGPVKAFPKRLEDLLTDQRLISVTRYLREIYPDPVMRGAWELIPAPDGGIQGVVSRSTAAPLRSGTVVLDTLVLSPASRYADWKFIYTPPPPPLSAPSTAAPDTPRKPAP